MSIIFQLFHADDLRSLSAGELQQIFQVIQNNKGRLQTTLFRSLNPGMNGTQFKNPEDLNATDEQRRQVVFRQLGLRQRGPLRLKNVGPKPPDQLNTEEDLKFLILAWAIDCEIGNRNFYEALKEIRDKAYAKYREITEGQEPKDPDSLYSPFNPRGPLYRLYNP